MELEEIMDRLAESLNAHRDLVRAIVDALPDEQIDTVVAECRRFAKPDDSHNFPVPSWDYVADMVESERVFRSAFRKAAAHMEATGEKNYCVHCGGTCTPEHIAEQTE